LRWSLHRQKSSACLTASRKKKEGSAIYPIQWVTDRTSRR
jgi:hypothetical protein